MSLPFVAYHVSSKNRMVRAHLGRDAFARARAGLEQRHLARGGEVQNVQPRAVPLREVDRHGRRFETRLHRADVRMLGHRDVVAVTRARTRFVGLNGGRVFAVRRDQQRCAGKDAFERGRVVDQHVAGRRPHENLHSAGERRIDGFDDLQVVVRGAEIEGVVRQRDSGGARMFIAQGRVRDRLRIAVRHLHVAGDAAGDRGSRFRGDRRLCVRSPAL